MSIAYEGLKELFDDKIYYKIRKYSNSQEQEDTWFLGSILKYELGRNTDDSNRLINLHNRITHDETKYDDRFKANKHIACQLEEFFPKKWLIEITINFRKINAKDLGIKTRKDRILSYLGYIELYLNFRGLTLLDSTLEEINNSLDSDITKNDVRSWKLKHLKLNLKLREMWVKIRASTHRTALISTIINIANKELVSSNLKKEEMFKLKQNILRLAKSFTQVSKSQYIKKPEIWAYAICLKALRETFPDKSMQLFKDLPPPLLKVIENKKWQLDQLF